jgi:Prion-inhibition and propagation
MATVAMAATVQLVDLFEGVVESFKLLLTPSFGSDYELLCTDLSVQLLRIRVWADSVSPHYSFWSCINTV